MKSHKPSNEIIRLIRAFGYSWKGLQAAMGQPAFRLEVYGFLVLAPLAIWLTQSSIERLLLIGSLLLVMIVEVLNSAIETVVDRISLEHHELSGRAKDMASAAVLLSLCNAAMVWVLVIF